MALLINFILSIGILYLLWVDNFTHKRMLLGAVFVIAVFIGLTNDLKNDYRVNYQFIESQCRIVSKSVEVKQFSRSTLYYPSFQVEYTIGDQIMNQTAMLNLTDYGSLSYDNAQLMASVFSQDQAYPCWYDPNNTSTVVLEKGWFTSINNWKYTLIGVIIFIIMLFYINPFSRIQ
jgi:hypothetical protein